MSVYGFNKLNAEASATNCNDSLMILNETGDEANAVFIEL
jgi:hypothetical protein